MKNWPLYQSLRGRGESLKTLAEKSKVASTTISMVFAGKRGACSRKHIAPHLTANELALLGWSASGELVRKGEEVSRGTSSQAN